jgi:methanogenic corrinoid protein MtbC1
MSNAVTAELLEASADGYASAAYAILEDSSKEPDSGSPRHRELWRTHFRQRLLELAAAVRLGEPQLFVDRACWLGRAYEARGLQPDELHNALTCLREALARNLPESLTQAAIEPIERALSALLADNPGPATALDPMTPAGRLGLEYIATCLEGRPDDAIRLVMDAVGERFGPADIYLKLLVPIQREIGLLWHAGEAGIAEERLVTETTRQLMTLLANRFAPPNGDGHLMLAAAVTGNAHDLGLRMVTDMFKLAGWRCLFLGANVPPEEIAQAAVAHHVDLVVLSATLTTQLKALSNTIAALHQIKCRAPVLIGGLALAGADEAWRQLGADGYASSIDMAVAEADKLLAGRSQH